MEQSEPGSERDSRLLASLPIAEKQRLEPFLERVDLQAEQVLVMRSEPIESVYFPVDAVTSTIVQLPDGDTLEVGLMGAEGLVGLSLILGERTSNATVFVQIAGRAYRMRSDDFQRLVLAAPGRLRTLLLRYTNAFMALVAQTAACNASHPVDQRLARWLLMVQDRVQRDELRLTQDFLALMLGVRRATVTGAAGGLRESGAIAYESGRIRVLQRDKLLAASCECYGVINETIEAIFDEKAA